MNNYPLILAFETSCDETAVAIYSQSSGVLANEIFSQINLHRQYGGVVPELAARDHLEKLPILLHSALEKAKLTLNDIELIAYTFAPGLPGALICGATFAKSLAFAKNIPTIAIHHLEGHLLSPLLGDEKPNLPFLALLVSGGHTQLLAVEKIGKYHLLGETLDDAVGEAFDKTAKMLNLPYPGGAEIAKLAQSGDENKYPMPLPMKNKQNLNFSFSGLKTAVRLLIEKENAQLDIEENKKIRADIAASFQKVVVNSLVDRSIKAWKKTNIQDLVIAGGVSANICLREELGKAAKKLNRRVFFPSFDLCGDNALMIAHAASYRTSQKQDKLEIITKPRMQLEDLPEIF